MRLRSGKVTKLIIPRNKKTVSIKNKNRKNIESSKELRDKLTTKLAQKRRSMNAQEARRLEQSDQLHEAAEIDLPSSEGEDDANRTLIENPRQIKTRKMSEYLTKVGQLKMEGNLSENWRRFKRNFDIFMEAGELTTKTDAIKVNTFLNAVGEEAVETFDSFNLTDVQRASYEDVIKAFADFCAPKKNTVYERYLFYQRKQREGESFDAFLIDIRRLVRTCEFKDNENEMLRDQIVMGVNSQKLQRNLLEAANLTYDTAVSKCRSHEATNEQTTTMNKIAAVNQIEERGHVGKQHTQHRKNYKGNNNKKKYNSNSNSNGNRNDKPNDRQGHQQHTQNRNQSANASTSNNDRSEKLIVNCRYCALTHKIRQCPAYGKVCTQCSRKNHYSTVCRSKNISAFSAYDSNFDYSDNDELYITSIEKVYAIEDDDDDVSYPWIEKISIEGKKVAFKIDTGAQINVMPLNVYKQLDTRIELHQTNVKLRAFSGEKLKPIGMCSLFGKFENMSRIMKTAVVDIDVMPILGLKSCIDFGIVSPSANARIHKTRTFTNSSYHRNNL